MTSSAAIVPPGGRRRQVIEVAAGLFAARGFHGVSMHEIGEAVGVSGPALYKHFAGKEALLGAMLVDISERLLHEGARRSAAARTDGPAAELAALVQWHVEFALTEPALITVQFRDLASLGDDDRATVRRLQRRYVEIWTAAIQAATGVDAAHARSSAHAVFGLINSTPHSARLDAAEMATLLERMALAALLA
jgi:AcrR family transcriptional regulator